MAGRLILVEDDADFRGFLRSQLTRRGYDVVVSASAEEALSQVATTFPDLVLTDVALTGMSGIDLCRQVWELGRDVPVIVVTGHGSLNVAVDALRAGAADFITKPVDVDVRCIARSRRGRSGTKSSACESPQRRGPSARSWARARQFRGPAPLCPASLERTSRYS